MNTQRRQISALCALWLRKRGLEHKQRMKMRKDWKNKLFKHATSTKATLTLIGSSYNNNQSVWVSVCARAHAPKCPTLDEAAVTVGVKTESAVWDPPVCDGLAVEQLQWSEASQLLKFSCRKAVYLLSFTLCQFLRSNTGIYTLCKQSCERVYAHKLMQANAGTNACKHTNANTHSNKYRQCLQRFSFFFTWWFKNQHLDCCLLFSDDINDRHCFTLSKHERNNNSAVKSMPILLSL